MRYVSASPQHETRLLYYVFCIAVILHGVIVASALFEDEWRPLYTWETAGFLSAVIGLLAWRYTAPNYRSYLLVIPATLCMVRWVGSWIWGAPPEIYSSVVSVLMYLPVLIGCGVLFRTPSSVGLCFSLILSGVALWGSLRPEIEQHEVGEWQISPSILGVCFLYMLFFTIWRRQVEMLHKVSASEHELNLTLQSTTAHQLSLRMGAASKLSGEVAHEFNNLLNVITPLCTYLAETLEDTESAEDVSTIQAASERMRLLSQDLLSLTQTARILEEESELVSTIQSMWGEVKSGEQSALSALNVEIDSKLETLRVSGTEGDTLKLIELLYEYLDAHPSPQADVDHGSVSLQLTSLGASQITPPLDEIPRGEVAVISITQGSREISHQGSGALSKPLRFKEFGSELGLTAAYAIALRCGGTIRGEMSDDDRLSFHVYLPTIYKQTSSLILNQVLNNSDVLTEISTPPEEAQSADRQSVDDHCSHDQRASIRSAQHILLVDDELMILKVIERGLKRIGFTVTSTTSPLEALEYLRRDAQQFDLLISDVKMPELSGPEMIQAAHAEEIALPTYLYITGYIDDQAAASFKVSKERVLFKPFTPETLRTRIFQLLSTDAPR